MKRDLLDSATRALRDETAEAEGGAKFTRARVMASLHQSQVRRRTRLAFILPIAACFAAASAFGMASGRGPELFRSVAEAFGLEPQRAPADAPKLPPKAAPRALAKPPARDVPAPLEAPSAAPPAPATTPAREAQRDKALAPALQPSARHEHDPAHELYRAAHRAHFSEQNHARALAAWESYLERAPRGRFAIEAEYNRALCLVRLGRRAEARRALEPFADGRRGGYRQRDAGELLDALRE